eukprot:GEMP01059452.1.p1 GENE.GEMP01059452.1~~GEMP01059452.1.p1  ORF type:complete len:309 (+),score=65.87 GEMP01059452.1:240-1166(+)
MASDASAPTADTIDVTVLAFAQWLSEMRTRSNASLQQMLAEMGIIRNGITSNNTDLTEFKRNTATVQQQMQSQITDLRDKLHENFNDIATMKKTKSQFEQEVHTEYHSLAEALQFKTLELESLKKAYSQTHQQLQQQILQLQAEVKEIRMKSDDAGRQTLSMHEQNINKMAEIEMAAQYGNNEMARLRSDHDHAIANVAENMNRWNDTLRDLSKEFHSFQKTMNANQQKMHANVWDLQKKDTAPQQQPNHAADGRPVAESVSDVSRNSYSMLPAAVMPMQQQVPSIQRVTVPQPQLRPQLRTQPLFTR